MTGDGRFIEANALYWDDLPLPIRYVSSDVGAHDGAQVVGRITRIWRGKNHEIMGEGDFDLDSPHGSEAMRQVGENLTNGVSMDLDDVSFEVRMSSELVNLIENEGVDPGDAAELTTDDEGRVKVAEIKSDDEVRITTQGRIRAATIVAIPAFAEAKIALVASVASIVELASEAPQDVPPEVQDAVQTLQKCDEHEFLSEGYMALAEQARDLFQAAVDKGFDQAQEYVDALDAFLAVNWTDLSAEHIEMPEELPEERPMLASAVPKAPPAAWFANPNLKQPTPLTVTDDGRVYGHLATWGTCHVGHAHSGCITAPRSHSNYAYFRVGSVLTGDGTEIATGRITLETRHALGTLSATQTLAHYEDTGKAVADVAAGEDSHGIWIAGAVRPNVSDDQIRALRGSPLSGDWRRVAGNLELVAALAVNVPGFPIPRTAGLVASGKLQSLVASGMLVPRQDMTLTDDDLSYLKVMAARERKNEADAMRVRVKTMQLAMKRKAFSL